MARTLKHALIIIQGESKILTRYLPSSDSCSSNYRGAVSIASVGNIQNAFVMAPATNNEVTSYDNISPPTARAETGKIYMTTPIAIEFVCEVQGGLHGAYDTVNGYDPAVNDPLANATVLQHSVELAFCKVNGGETKRKGALLEEADVEVTFVAPDGVIARAGLDEGNALTFKPTTFTITADLGNPNSSIILVDGNSFVIPPGGTISIKPSQPVGGEILGVDMTRSHLINGKIRQ